MEVGAEAEVRVQGKLDRSYCLDCGSRKIEDLTYITHSCSKVRSFGGTGKRNVKKATYDPQERLEFIFGDLLPPLAGKSVLDIGSRLGAVLYGAYYYSQVGSVLLWLLMACPATTAQASQIVGVEINPDFCKLQEEVIATKCLGDRIKVKLPRHLVIIFFQVVKGNMIAQTQLLASADVTVLNNVFSWFMPANLQVNHQQLLPMPIPMPLPQVKMWQCIQKSLSPGSLLVTIPSLETSLEGLNTGINLSTWVRPMSGYTPSETQVGSSELFSIFMFNVSSLQVELSEIKLYQVLPKS